MKYLPPKLGGGLPTTNVSSAEIFIVVGCCTKYGTRTAMRRRADDQSTVDVRDAYAGSQPTSSESIAPCFRRQATTVS